MDAAQKDSEWFQHTSPVVRVSLDPKKNAPEESLAEKKKNFILLMAKILTGN